MKRQLRTKQEEQRNMQLTMTKVLKMTGTALLATSIGVSTLASSVPFNHSMVAHAEEATVTTGTTEDGYAYSIDSATNEVTITKYTGTESSVTIPDTIDGKPVTTIGEKAFASNKTIITLTFGANIKSVGNSAFDGLGYLTTLNLNDNLETIGQNAFIYNSKLTAIDMSHTKVKTIGKHAIASNTSLTTVKFSPELSELGYGSFSGDTKLTGLDFSTTPKLKAIGEGAFNNNTGLVSVKLGSSIEEIGPDAFSSIANTTIEMKEATNLKTIGNGAFKTSKNITIDGIPDNVETIGDTAFYQSSTTFGSGEVLVLPSKLKTLGMYAIGGKSYNTTENPKITKIVTNAGLESVGDYAFAYNPNLTEVDLSASTKLTTLPNHLFDLCTNLYLDTNKLPQTLTVLNELGNQVHYKDDTLNIPRDVESIPSNSFTINKGFLKEINFNSKLKEIKDNAFKSMGTSSDRMANPMVTLNFPEDSQLTTIGANVFAYMGVKGDLVIPNNVTYIGSGAFAYNPITSVVIPEKTTKLLGQTFYTGTRDKSTLKKVVVFSRYLSFDQTDPTYVFGNNSELAVYAYRGSTTETLTLGKGFLPLDDMLLPTINSDLVEGKTYSGEVNPVFNIVNSNTTTYTLDGSPYDGVSPITMGGNHVLRVSATNEITTTSKTYNFTIKENHAPTVSSQIADQTVYTNETLKLDISQYFTDIDNDSLSYEATTSDNSNSGVSVTADGVLKFTASTDNNYTVTVKAKDNVAYSEPIAFKVTVSSKSTNTEPDKDTTGTGNEPTETDTSSEPSKQYLEDLINSLKDFIAGLTSGTGSGTGSNPDSSVVAKPTDSSVVNDMHINTLNKDYKLNITSLLHGLDSTGITYNVINSNTEDVISNFDQTMGVLTLQGLQEGFSTVTVQAKDGSGNTSSVTLLVYVEPKDAASTATSLETAPMSISDAVIGKGSQLYTADLTTVFGDKYSISDIASYTITLTDTTTEVTSVVHTSSLQKLSVAPSLLDTLIASLPSTTTVKGLISSNNVKAAVVGNQLMLEGLGYGTTKMGIKAVLKDGRLSPEVRVNLQIINAKDTDSTEGKKVDLPKDLGKEPLNSDQYGSINKDAKASKESEYNQNKDLLTGDITKEDIRTLIDITNKYGIINNSLSKEDITSILDILKSRGVYSTSSSSFEGIKELLEKLLASDIKENKSKSKSFKFYSILASKIHK